MRRILKWLINPIFRRFPRVERKYRAVRTSWYNRQEDRQFAGEPPLTPMGFKLIGNEAMQMGLFEPEETRLVRDILPHVEVVVNVGANIGYYCCIALSQGKEVIAFEPMPRNLRYLFRNIRANQWDSNIEVCPIALCDRIGVIEMYGERTGASLVKGWAGASEHGVNLVPTSTLNNILGNRLQKRASLFIVDIEGAEQRMLEGASSLLQMDPKPIWMMEISVSEHQPKGTSINPNLRKTFQVFWKNGYEARTADRQRRSVNAEELEEIVRSGKDTLVTHNFLFVERAKVEILFPTGNS